MRISQLPSPTKHICRRILQTGITCLLFACALIVLTSISAAQTAGAPTKPDATSAQAETKTSVTENGTQTITQTQETERKVTSDGEVVIERFRSPSWAGDDAVTWEREVRTKKLPDGTTEREYVVRSRNGANDLAPVQVIREKTTPGKDSTTTERETLRPDLDGNWQAVQKETITEKGPEATKQIVKDVQQPDNNGGWQTVERQISSTRASAGQKESEAVRQIPDAFGQLSDYERQQERTSKTAGTETREFTLQRRDTSNTDSREFFLVQRTTTKATTTAPGTTTRHSVTESDLLSGTARNLDSSQPQVVEERTEVDRTAPEGSKQVEITVSGRTAADPTAVRPAYKIVQQTDRNGYARQIYIPAQQQP